MNTVGSHSTNPSLSPIESSNVGESSIEEKAALNIQRIFRGFSARTRVIHVYIKKNFHLITNVQSIRQASVIYLGESHIEDTHALRNAWIIDRLYKENDKVLVERPDEKSWKKGEKSLSQERYVQKSIELAGWDLKLRDPQALISSILALNNALSLFENFMDTQITNSEREEIFYTIVDLLKELPQTQNVHESIEDFILRDPECLKKAFQDIPATFLQQLIFSVGKAAKEEMEKYALEGFCDRQASLIRRVKAERQDYNKAYRKIFVIAGYAHLIQVRSVHGILYPIQENEKAENKIEKDLAPSLTQHTYAILKPKNDSPLSKEEKEKILNLKKQTKDLKVATNVHAKLRLVTAFTRDIPYDNESRYLSWQKSLRAEKLEEATVAQEKSFQDRSPEFRRDKEAVLKSIREDPDVIKYVSKNFKNDEEVVKEALNYFGLYLEYASERLKGAKEVVMLAVQQDGNALQFASELLKEDEEIVMAAVREKGTSLRHASKDLRNREDIVLAALSQTSEAFPYASDSLKQNRNIVLAALRQNGALVKEISTSFYDDKEIALTALQSLQKGRKVIDKFSPLMNFIYHLTKTFPDDKEIALGIVSVTGNIYVLDNNHFQEDEEVRAAALRVRKK